MKLYAVRKEKLRRIRRTKLKTAPKLVTILFHLSEAMNTRLSAPTDYLTWLIRAISGHLCVCERLGKKNVQATAAKTVLKKPSELALLQSSSRLFQFTSYFSCQKKADCPRDEFLGITSEFRKRKKISS